jgi:hypothetical protein
VTCGLQVETRRKTRARESSRRSLAGLTVRILLRPTQLRVRHGWAGPAVNAAMTGYRPLMPDLIRRVEA